MGHLEAEEAFRSGPHHHLAGVQDASHRASLGRVDQLARD